MPELGAERVDLMRLPLEDRGRVEGISERVAALLSDKRDWTGELRDIATKRYDWAIRADQMAQAYRRYAGL